MIRQWGNYWKVQSNCDIYVVWIFSLLLCQSGYSKYFGRFEERAERTLVHVYLAVIDELDQRMEIVEGDILQYDHWVFAWCALWMGEWTKCGQLDFFPLFAAHIRLYYVGRMRKNEKNVGQRPRKKSKKVGMERKGCNGISCNAYFQRLFPDICTIFVFFIVRVHQKKKRKVHTSSHATFYRFKLCFWEFADQIVMGHKTGNPVKYERSWGMRSIHEEWCGDRGRNGAR